MAMRPDVRRHALVVIVFSLAQWFSCATSLRMNYLTLRQINVFFISV